MLKERIFRSFFANVLIALVVLGVFGLTYFTIDSPVKGSASGAINRGTATDKVAIVFIVYDNSDKVDNILKILDDKKVNATFFVGGSWVVKNDELLKKINNYGNELGNSGYFKKDFATLVDSAARDELQATHKLVEAMTGVAMTHFLPPTSTYGKNTIEIAKNLGYNTLMWTVNTESSINNATNVLKKATENINGGDFILMHPTQSAVEALPRVIDILKEVKKIKPANISEVL